MAWRRFQVEWTSGSSEEPKPGRETVAALSLAYYEFMKTEQHHGGPERRCRGVSYSPDDFTRPAARSTHRVSAPGPGG